MREKGREAEEEFTSMSTQVASEGVAPATGVVAEGTFEGFFACMQLDVSQ